MEPRFLSSLIFLLVCVLVSHHLSGAKGHPNRAAVAKSLDWVKPFPISSEDQAIFIQKMYKFNKECTAEMPSSEFKSRCDNDVLDWMERVLGIHTAFDSQSSQMYALLAHFLFHVKAPQSGVCYLPDAANLTFVAPEQMETYEQELQMFGPELLNPNDPRTIAEKISTKNLMNVRKILNQCQAKGVAIITLGIRDFDFSSISKAKRLSKLTAGQRAKPSNIAKLDDMYQPNIGSHAIAIVINNARKTVSPIDPSGLRAFFSTTQGKTKAFANASEGGAVPVSFLARSGQNIEETTKILPFYEMVANLFQQIAPEYDTRDLTVARNFESMSDTCPRVRVNGVNHPGLCRYAHYILLYHDMNITYNGLMLTIIQFLSWVYSLRTGKELNLRSLPAGGYEPPRKVRAPAPSDNAQSGEMQISAPFNFKRGVDPTDKGLSSTAQQPGIASRLLGFITG